MVCVEPIDADALFCSAATTGQERSVSDGGLDSIMQGLNCGEPSFISWDAIRQTTDTFLTIPDNLACEAVRLLDADGVVSGESGAAGLAGALAEAKSAALDENSRVLVVSTEGDTDPTLRDQILRRSCTNCTCN